MFDRELHKAKLNRKAVAAIIGDAAAFATTLHIISLITYGEEIYEIDILELYIRLKEDFGMALPEENEQKLQAIITATSTDAFYQDVRAFQAIANTLIEGDPGFETLEELTVAEIFWALYEVELNHGEDEVCEEIQRLIAKEIAEEADDYAGIAELRPHTAIREMAVLRNKLRTQLVDIGLDDIKLPHISAS